MQALPQYCDQGGDFVQYMLDFEFINAFTCMSAEMSGGFLVVTTLIFGGIGLSIYIRTGSVALPGILLLLTGGAIIGTLGAPAVAIATVLLLVLGAGSFTYAYYWYAR